MTRRVLLRSALVAGAGVAIAALAACTANRAGPGVTSGRTSAGEDLNGHTIPEDLRPIPQGFTSAAERQGSLVELIYDTYESATYEQKTRSLSKRAIIYLPYGYTDEDRYDVFYLMHGGWGDETTTLGTPDAPSAFKNVLDNAIAAGDIIPMIVVCPTYNNTSPDDSADFTRAMTLTQNYHHELLNDLIPAVENQYSTYADDVSSTGLAASRDHRGFGGFSMGAVTTWRTFQYGLDYFRYFLPMSCGTTLDMGNIASAARTHDLSDYFVWIITGSQDFAHPNEEDRVAFLQNSPYFMESDNEQDGNFTFRVKDGYTHDEAAAMEYTYNGLRWFWNV